MNDDKNQGVVNKFCSQTRIFQAWCKFVVGQSIGRTATVQGIEANEGGDEELGTGWRRMISFTIRPFLPSGRKSAVKIDYEVGLDPELARIDWD
jgi:hypothetical protein